MRCKSECVGVCLWIMASAAPHWCLFLFLAACLTFLTLICYFLFQPVVFFSAINFYIWLFHLMQDISVISDVVIQNWECFFFFPLFAILFCILSAGMSQHFWHFWLTEMRSVVNTVNSCTYTSLYPVCQGRFAITYCTEAQSLVLGMSRSPFFAPDPIPIIWFWQSADSDFSRSDLYAMH